MNLAKKIIIKSTISLFMGAASLVGTRLASTIWDKCAVKEKAKI